MRNTSDRVKEYMRIYKLIVDHLKWEYNFEFTLAESVYLRQKILDGINNNELCEDVYDWVAPATEPQARWIRDFYGYNVVLLNPENVIGKLGPDRWTKKELLELIKRVRERRELI